jgi:hypothetical protein
MIEFLPNIQDGSDHLVVAFTGVGQALGGIPFEFHKSLGAVGVSALLVRDLGARWYQYDRKELDGVVGRIRQTAALLGARRVSCMGNSMGGFGALLFGALCNADRILAFAPQTTILPAGTGAIGDGRWRRYQKNISEYTLPDINEVPAPSTVPVLHYGHTEQRDCEHVQRLIWPAEKLGYYDCGHDVAAYLKSHDRLLETIQQGLQIDPV